MLFIKIGEKIDIQYFCFDIAEIGYFYIFKTLISHSGFNQGIQALVMRIGMILGPIWTTAMVDNYVTIMAVVNMSISIIPLVNRLITAPIRYYNLIILLLLS